MLTLEELIAAKEQRVPIIFQRWSNEPPLHFERISAIVPCVDRKGNPSFYIELTARNGCTAIVGAHQITLDKEAKK